MRQSGADPAAAVVVAAGVRRREGWADAPAVVLAPHRATEAAGPGGPVLDRPEGCGGFGTDGSSPAGVATLHGALIALLLVGAAESVPVAVGVGGQLAWDTRGTGVVVGD